MPETTKQPSIVYERNSRKIKSRLEKEGWIVHRVAGDHHTLKHPKKQGRITLCHPVKDLPIGTVRQIYKQAGWTS